MDAFELIFRGLHQVFEWIVEIEYLGISVYQVAIFGLVIGLLWRFGLSPIFGRSPGSLSIGASDVVRRINKNNNSK